jgi:hypothetical protein
MVVHSINLLMLDGLGLLSLIPETLENRVVPHLSTGNFLLETLLHLWLLLAKWTLGPLALLISVQLLAPIVDFSLF